MNTQYCFMTEENIPSRDKLQVCIKALGFDLELDPALDIRNDEGFSPCKLEGYDNVGFELEFGTTDDLFEEDEEFAKHTGNRNHYFSMSWGSSFSDCLAVMIVTKAMLKYFDAVTTYDCEELDSIQDIENGIQESLNELKKAS